MASGLQHYLQSHGSWELTTFRLARNGGYALRASHLQGRRLRARTHLLPDIVGNAFQKRRFGETFPKWPPQSSTLLTEWWLLEKLR